MSSLDHAPGTVGTIMKIIGPTLLVNIVSTRLGGAGVVTEVPSGMDTLLGIWAHMDPLITTNDEAVNAWGYLDTEDGFNLKPFEFLYPNQGCGGDTTSTSHSVSGIFYPINCPVVPGGRLEAYGQGYFAHVGDPTCSVTYLFGKNIVLPKSMDDHPGRHRWRKVNHALTPTVAAGFAPAPQYQFTLSARGGALTEVGGLIWTDTQDPAACNGGSTLQISSPDVPVMPMEFNLNAFGAALGVASAHDGSDCVTRRACSAFGERVVHIDAQLAMNAGAPIVTGNFVSMVEFVRRGE